MSNYKIITDSTCDLPPHVIKELKIHVIPMEYTLDGINQFQDIFDKGEKTIAFYNHLKDGKKPATSMINTQRYIDIFSSYLDQGRDVLHISFSSGLSGSHNASRMAAEELNVMYPDRKIIIIDSKAASIGQGLLVYHAAVLKNQGMEMSELVEWIKENTNQIRHWFTVEDLHHLKRGGRIGVITANVGTVLNIKPILSVDADGKLMNVCKVMGRKKSLNELLNRMKAEAVTPEEQIVIIGHGDSMEDALLLEKKIRQTLSVKEVILTYIGPIIGSHTGPGMVGLTFLGKKIEE
jgi:DegV family protein with EDD domain